MLSRKARVPKEELHSREYRNERTPFFSLKTKPNDRGAARIAVIVGKTVDKRATQRNFWKRQVKAAFQKIKGPHHDLVITILPKVKTLSKKQFREELAKLLER